MFTGKRTAAILSLIIVLSLALGLTASAISLFGGKTETQAPPEGAPIAIDINLKTYRNLPIHGMFQAVDPEGDQISFKITSEPRRGSLTAGDSNSQFVYTPQSGKTGSDEFTYIAVDSNGNESSTATVSIRIDKQSSKVSYSDTSMDTAAYAAIRLAEEGIFTGCSIGGSYCFMPDSTVTRGEFIAMTMTLVGADKQNGTSITGFSDDEDIADWLRPHVNAALKAGIIHGIGADGGALCLEPWRELTRAEAAVILSSALSISDIIIENAFSDDVPSWAYQAAVNVSTCGIMPTNEAGVLGYSQSVTRSEAAVMLLAALELMESRGSSQGLFSWAK